ncbi:EamA family transporter [Thermococcus barophilus]|uniref:Membrane protein n=1 Tax=Thermococcus barophilus (strain DSM 11836 / MP) TaxID=391623 RepID=F0LI89_THEBM|nr:EamA family transporter [Thermococcus barophilus]ADT84419.1 putative membrane protein [Thermococcus barophilus MP]
MTTYIFYALLSALFAALVAIFGKLGLENVDSTLATTIRAGVMFFFLLFFSLATGKLDLNLNTRFWIFIMLSGVAGALSWLFYFMALKNGNVSTVVAIDRLSIVFAVLFAWFIFKEEVTIRTLIGALLIVAGAIMVSLK